MKLTPLADTLALPTPSPEARKTSLAEAWKTVLERELLAGLPTPQSQAFKPRHAGGRNEEAPSPSPDLPQQDTNHILAARVQATPPRGPARTPTHPPPTAAIATLHDPVITHAALSESFAKPTDNAVEGSEPAIHSMSSQSKTEVTPRPTRLTVPQAAEVDRLAPHLDPVADAGSPHAVEVEQPAVTPKVATPAQRATGLGIFNANATPLLGPFSGVTGATFESLSAAPVFVQDIEASQAQDVFLDAIGPTAFVDARQTMAAELLEQDDGGQPTKDRSTPTRALGQEMSHEREVLPSATNVQVTAEEQGLAVWVRDPGGALRPADLERLLLQTHILAQQEGKPVVSLRVNGTTWWTRDETDTNFNAPRFDEAHPSFLVTFQP